LNRLLAAQERRPSPVAAIPDGLAAIGTLADLKEGIFDVPAESLLAVSQNPHSVGRFQVGRKFTVGDAYLLRYSDMITGITGKTSQIRVTRVDEVNDRVEMNQGKLVLDLMGNIIENAERAADVPEQFLPAELQIGKHWVSLTNTLLKTGNSAGKTMRVQMDVRILARENIRVPAGEFNAFRIEASGWSVGDGRSTKIEIKLWVVPGINMFIRKERIKRHSRGRIETQRIELVAIRQAASGLAD